MKITLLALLLCSAFACGEPFSSSSTDIQFEAPPVVRYTRADIQKMRWIDGVWKSTRTERPLQQSFQFNPDNSLEMIETGDSGNPMSTLLTWHAGCFYLGDNREWVVTWIGEKDVRFEPTRPGKNAFTWTRFGEDQWYHVQHTPRGDKPLLMERTASLQP